MQISLLFLTLFASIASADKTPSCKPGQHWVRAHHRRAYIRADGAPVSASAVTPHCQNNPPSLAKWNERLKVGTPPRWIQKNEKPKAWTTEEKERVLEALASLPLELLRDSIDGNLPIKAVRSLRQKPGKRCPS